jgi:hypothetical protein
MEGGFLSFRAATGTVGRPFPDDAVPGIGPGALFADKSKKRKAPTRPSPHHPHRSLRSLALRASSDEASWHRFRVRLLRRGTGKTGHSICTVQSAWERGRRGSWISQQASIHPSHKPSPLSSVQKRRPFPPRGIAMRWALLSDTYILRNVRHPPSNIDADDAQASRLPTTTESSVTTSATPLK